MLAGQREVGRLRRGLRLLRPVALCGGGHADARDDGPRADPGARQGGRGGGGAPVLHGHPGAGAFQARFREDRRWRPAGRRAHQLEALRVDRPHLGRSRQASRRRRRAARPPQRRDRALLLPGGDDHGPLRGPHPHHRRGQGGGPGDLRRRHPQPWRVAPPAGRDGVRAGRDRPHLGAHQPAQPEVWDQVRRPAADGPVGGRQVGGDLPADPPGRPLPPLRWAGREPRRAAAPGGQGGPQRGDDGELPDHPGGRAGRRPRDVRGAGTERGATARQRRQPPARQPFRLARGRGAADPDGRARRQPGRGRLLGSIDPAPGGQEEEQAAARTRSRPGGATEFRERRRRAAGGASAGGAVSPHEADREPAGAAGNARRRRGPAALLQQLPRPRRSPTRPPARRRTPRSGSAPAPAPPA